MSKNFTFIFIIRILIKMIPTQIEEYTTQSLVTLDLVLQKLACKLNSYPSFNNDPDLKPNKVQLLTQLLKKIDYSYFNKKLTKNSDYQILLKSICDYYSQKKEQQIKKLFLIENNYKNKFVHIFQLVLDLAIGSSEKEVYLNEIIRMGEREKEVLLTFFDEVMKRNFIQKQSGVYDSLLEIKDQEYQELRENFQQLYHDYYELLENHNSMKLMNEKLQKQNNDLLKEKEDLMSELGIEGRHTFLDIAEKYHNDVKDYEIFIERISKELQVKNNLIKSKDQQIHEMTSSLTSLKESSLEVQNLIGKNKELEEVVINLVEKESKAKQEIDKNEVLIEALRKQIQEKDFSIMQLSQTKDKYYKVKQAHLTFKRQFQAKTTRFQD